MTVLIDTHVLLWWFDDPQKLSATGREMIEDINNIIYVSAAVIWEITIKKQLGKLQSPDSILQLMSDENFTPLAITHEHASALEQLPAHHQDPFDRIQIAQTLTENLVFLTRDRKILKYDLIKTVKA